MEYKSRIIDNLLDLKLEAFGATLIKGPKGCGKTTSAKQKAKSFVEFQDEEVRDNLLAVAKSPDFLTSGKMLRNCGELFARILMIRDLTDSIYLQVQHRKWLIHHIREH